jgi:cyclase
MIKRIVGVITVMNNWAVQSIGYNTYRPLGRPEIIAQNLDRWQLEEIVVSDISRSRHGLGPNIELLETIAQKKISTPLTYIGGIRDVSDALKVIKSGADRIGIESLIDSKPEAAKNISLAIGAQALVIAQSVFTNGNGLKKFNYIDKTTSNLNTNKILDNMTSASELLLIDVKNEGKSESFDKKILTPFHESDIQIICFGGISTGSQISNLLNNKNVSAVGIGNFLNYSELANWNLIKNSQHKSTRQLSYGKLTQGAKEWF